MVKQYDKSEIIQKGLIYRKDFFKIEYSRHALQRLQERLKGNLLLYPKTIRITENNIVKGLSSDDKFLFKVVIKMEWKPREDIYLVIYLPLCLVKTIYFKKQKS